MSNDNNRDTLPEDILQLTKLEKLYILYYIFIKNFYLKFLEKKIKKSIPSSND